MNRCLLSVSLCLALLISTLSAWGMSRLFDGDAQVWQRGDTLCFGGKAFKSPGMFFNRLLDVDQRQVAVSYIEVYRDPYETLWAAGAEDPTVGAPLRSDTCFAYGQAIPGFKQTRPAQSLVPGLYHVTLNGRDSAGDGARATFMRTFCLAPRGDRLAVVDAIYDKTLGRWRCDPA
ncbi:hypothetical protein [Pseudomonas pseudonitroreducens]|uniref:hypothetical protein n=1 Tax=Pseudomonas pseudonitroreducens TaxID=2892326 RepID=UPI001F3FBC75|nr:hypothetical protein [Pseudomonas pseudonitroreducens]